MKILRVRRGFTTNSSSYTEWLPPPNGAANTSAAPGPNSPVQASAGPASVAPPAPVQGTTVAPPAQQAAPATGSNLAGNTTTVLGLVAALAAVFLGERVFRRLRRSPEQEEGEENE